MSFEAMTWAVRAKTENSGQKLVLLLLANHSNGHTGQCNPSHKLLADECCMGVSTLKNHISRLEAMGFLTVQHRAAEGVSLPNQYILKIQRGGSDFGGRVGQNLADGGSDFGLGVGQNLATKQEVKTGIEPGIEPREAPRKRSAALTCPSDVDPQTWGDWQALRKAKRAPVTETVLAGARREADKAGMTLEAFLQVWCRRGSQGLEAAWLKPDERTGSRSGGKYDAAAAAIFDGLPDGAQPFFGDTFDA
jgi:hypothetical protein